MLLPKKDKKQLIRAALNLSENDTVISNVKIVNVLSGEIMAGNVYIKGAYISFVDYELGPIPEGIFQIDGESRYLTPGFIDAHMHIESSMLTPRNFAEMVVPYGTTTVVCDPHEMANVFGIAGIEYFLQNGEELPMRQLIDIPSCVPSVAGLENSGATLYAKDIESIIKNDRIVGLAEVMDYEGVIHSSPKITDMIAEIEKNGKYIQGHAPKLTQNKLAAYLIGGPISDHESSRVEEWLEKYRQGMHIDLRDSNTNKNLEIFAAKVSQLKYKDRFSFCTDDRRCNVTLKEGHINALVRKTIRAGMDPIDAIRMASYNAANEMNIPYLGAIAPGYVADLLLLDSFESMKPSLVIFEGQVVAENGGLKRKIPPKKCSLEEINSINLPSLKREDLMIKAPDSVEDTAAMNFIEYESFTSSFTKVQQDTFRVKNGFIDISDKADTMFAAVLNRYGLRTKSVTVVKKFGIHHGAVASSISHDSHNITVVYDTPENGLTAIERLVKQKGGMAAVENGEILSALPLPVGGLMSLDSAEKVAAQVEDMSRANKKLGNIYLENPISRITILALLVSPDVKLSDLGMVDVERQEIIPLFPTDQRRE